MGFLRSIFGGGSSGAPTPPPPPPSIAAPGVSNALGLASAAAMRARAALAAGFGDSGTLLTGGRGAKPGSTENKSLTGTVLQPPKELTGA